MWDLNQITLDQADDQVEQLFTNIVDWFNKTDYPNIEDLNTLPNEIKNHLKLVEKSTYELYHELQARVTTICKENQDNQVAKNLLSQPLPRDIRDRYKVFCKKKEKIESTCQQSQDEDVKTKLQRVLTT